MSYGEFCKLTKLEPGPESFRLWVLMHGLTPSLRESVFTKLRLEAQRP